MTGTVYLFGTFVLDVGARTLTEQDRLIPIENHPFEVLRACVEHKVKHPNEPIPYDDLIAAVWGKRTPNEELKTLQTHMSAVRKAIRCRGGVPQPQRSAGDTVYIENIDRRGYQIVKKVSHVGAAAVHSAQSAPRLHGVDELPVTLWDTRFGELRVSTTDETVQVLTHPIQSDITQGFDLSINTVAGCPYGCKNCTVPKSGPFKETQKRFLNGPFGRAPTIYKNAPKELKRRLQAGDLADKRLIFSSYADAFFLEQERMDGKIETYIPEMLSELASIPAFKWILFCTRSPSIAEFKNVLQDIGRSNKIEVSIYLSTDKEQPNHYDHPAEDLLSAAATFRRAGIPVRLAISPLLPHSDQFADRVVKSADWIYIDPDGTSQVHPEELACDEKSPQCDVASDDADRVVDFLNEVEMRGGLVCFDPSLYSLSISEIRRNLATIRADDIASELRQINNISDHEKIIAALGRLRLLGIKAASEPAIIDVLLKLLLDDNLGTNVWPKVADTLSALGGAAALTDGVVSRLAEIRGRQGIKNWSDAAHKALTHFGTVRGRLMRGLHGGWILAPRHANRP